MTFADRFAILGATLLITAGMAGCGRGASGQVAVRVGGVTISRAAVDHWARAIVLGGPAAISAESSHDTPRKAALDFLISAHWIISEAAERGLVVSAGAVQKDVRERERYSLNGIAEFQRDLSSTGQTIYDVRLETKAALAAAMLRKAVLRQVPKVTPSEVAAFYRRHRHLFREDRRIVDLIEGIKSPAAAIALGRLIEPGSRFAQRAIRETVRRPTLFEAEYSENRGLVRSIFATSPAKIGGPVHYNNAWVLLVVRAMLPGATKPFPTVDAEIAIHLSKERQRSAFAKFLKIYRDKWIARTNCRAGFVVQKCSQYRGFTEPEANPLESSQ